MKTVKKLFSLLLVAVLLMSAIPFQASAEENAEETVKPHVINFWHKDIAGGSTIGSSTVSATKSGDNWVPASVPASRDGYTLKYWTVSTSGTQQATSAIQAGFTEAQFKDNGAGTMFIDVFAHFEKNHVHNFETVVNTVDPDCVNGGYTVVKCACGEEKQIDAVPALGHLFGEWTVVTAAGVGTAGVQRRDCDRCDAYETDEIDALPVPTYPVTFISTESGETFTRNWPINNLITELPAPKSVINKRFDGWYTQPAGGERVQVGNTWYGQNQYTTLYARFVDSVNDNASTISVFVRFYSEGVQQGETVLLDQFTVADHSKLLAQLQAKQAAFANKIYAIKSSNDYAWNESFYMYATGEKIADSDMTVDGDTSILLKVEAKKSARANVLLYVHNKAGEAAVRLYDMPGYTAGNTVTSAAVQNFLKAQTGKTYTISGLYNEDTWDQLNDGQNPTAAGGLTVPASGTLKIHVVLSNYSSSGSITTKPSDSTNPATGDTIMITAGIMALSAAAVVTLMQLRKRKMI